MVTDWPGLNSRVWLRLPCCGAEHPTRVDDYIGDDCAVGAPMAPHMQFVNPPKRGGFFLGWVAGGRGALEAPVDLVRTIEEPIPTWVIRSIGDAVQTQRRNFVRLNYETEVKLHLIEGGGAASIARTLDVSEGGLRCVVDEWAPDPGGRHFKVELPFNGTMYLIHAQVAWWGNLNEDDTRVVGVKFVDINPSAADAIRQYIFATQLEERRRARA